MIDLLNQERQWFQFINSEASNQFFDLVMPWITDLHKEMWFILGVVPFLLYLWARKQGVKKFIPLLVGLIISVGGADLIAAKLLKPTFARPRPPAVEKQIVVRTKRFAGYGFPSNHAANCFAGAAFLSWVYPGLTLIYLAIASLVGISRIYVGVHYPFDIMAGALLGLLVGTLVHFTLKKTVYDRLHIYKKTRKP